jgi:hypothetical protein
MSARKDATLNTVQQIEMDIESIEPEKKDVRIALEK